MIRWSANLVIFVGWQFFSPCKIRRTRVDAMPLCQCRRIICIRTTNDLKFIYVNKADIQILIWIKSYGDWLLTTIFISNFNNGSKVMKIVCLPQIHLNYLNFVLLTTSNFATCKWRKYERINKKIWSDTKVDERKTYTFFSH